MSCRSVVVYTMLGVLLVLCRSSFGQPAVRDDLELQEVKVSVVPPPSGQQPRPSPPPPPPPPPSSQPGLPTEHTTTPSPPPSSSSTTSSYSIFTSQPPPPPRMSSALATRSTSTARKTSTTLTSTTTTRRTTTRPDDDDDNSHDEDDPDNDRRSKRQLTGSADLRNFSNQLNELRRTVGAADMYHVSWDPHLEKIAAGLTSTCQLQNQAVLELPPDEPPPTEPDLPIADAQGLTGYVNISAVGSVLRKIYDRGSADPFCRQIMWSRMAHIGCAIGKFCPPYRTKRGTVFACIFTYTRPVPDAPLIVQHGTNCSLCDRDALWCDDGLCRRRCRPDGAICDKNSCDQQCSSCGGIINSCQCVCYYDGDRTRCEESTETATKYEPICRVRPPKRNGAWIALTIGVTGILVIVVISIACCVRRCREMAVCRRRSASPRSTTAVQPMTTDTATTTTTTPATSSASSTSVVVLPPPYEAVVRPNPDDDDPANKPPPYCFEPPLFVVPTPCPSYEAATAAAAVAGFAPTSGGGAPNRTAPSGERRRTTNRVDSTHVNRAFESDTHHT